MINNELLEWIRRQLGSGQTMDQVSRQLRTQGWTEADLTEAYNAISKSLAEEVKPTPPPAAPPLTSGPNVIIQPTGVKIASASHGGLLPKLFAVLLTLSFVGGVGYAYYAKIGPFSNPPYTQDNLLSGLLNSFASINSSTYSLSGSISTNPRDADAVPFVLKTADDSDKIQKYKNDYKRITDAGRLISALSYDYGPSSFSHIPFPVSLDKIIKDNSIDKYPYEVTEGGKNFKLTITFDTTEAIANLTRAIKSAGDKGSIIDGQTVTFNKDSSQYLQYDFSPELPKPFFVQLQDSAVYLPSDMGIMTTISATTDWTKADADWTFNLDANGNFGDLSYKVNADALRKDSDIYFRINKFPSIFGFPPDTLRGNWAKIDTKAATTTGLQGYSQSASISSSIANSEESYKKNRADLTAILHEAVKIADETHLISILNKPASERLNGVLLYRYELEINKTAIPLFYQKMVSVVDSSNAYSYIFSDPSVVNYMQGSEFDEVMDYFKKNTKLTLWVNASGMPARVENSIRIVPPDTAKALKDKQVNFKSTLTISDINVPVTTTAPINAKPLDELIGAPVANSAELRDSKRIADMGSIQQALALYYDSNSKYPPSMNDLVTANFLPTLPAGPNAGEKYSYAASPDGLSYHLGATLEATAAGTGVLASDMDCSSALGAVKLCNGFTKGVKNGFSGADSASCNDSSAGACYDVSP